MSSKRERTVDQRYAQISLFMNATCNSRSGSVFFREAYETRPLLCSNSGINWY